ncbi:MAG: ABC transporter permease, partial [Eggerthellaceae bacterium]|nr:ABC transporter permease [Eggerthellaceae bacterium]
VLASAFAKEISRSIAHSLGRFIALFAISALGVGFYAGLLMTGPDMRMATDEYYDGTVFHDIRIVSTLGVDEDDVHTIRMVDGVAAVMAVHETDVLGLLHDEQYVFRIHSLPDSAASSVRDGVNVISGDPDYLNRLLLEEGRWPAAPDECLISGDRVMSTP